LLSPSLCRLDKREKIRKDDNIVNLENILVNNVLPESSRARLNLVPIAPNVLDETIYDFSLAPSPTVLAQVQSGLSEPEAEAKAILRFRFRLGILHLRSS
jgi:hypothetical protein